MRRAAHRSRGRALIRKAHCMGLVVSVASGSAALAAQPARTGWEDVKPTGWPAQSGAPTAPLPSTEPTAVPDAHVATRRIAASAAREGVPAPARSSRASRRARRHGGSRRPSAPAWITLEWETPPSIALDWTPRLLSATPVSVGMAGCIEPAAPTRIAPLLDAAAAMTEEAQLPVAAWLDRSAIAPLAPRSTRIADILPSTAHPRRTGFKAWMTRVAEALGLSRAESQSEPPRVARLDGDER